MPRSRREVLGLGIRVGAGIGFITIMPFAARAQQGGGTDTYPTDGGEITVHPVSHASLVLETPAGVIYVDPVGDASQYADLPPPDMILVTHEHGDHYNADTLAAIAGADTGIISNPAVHAMLPADLQQRARAMANGESASLGEVAIEAIPAYNTTEGRLNYHPEGRDNGYVLTIDGRRVYIAGDTEDIPEMRALDNIDIAFVPMNLPFTMSVVQAASAVAEFAPRFVYPYHHRGSDVQAFATAVEAAAADITPVLREWY